MRFDVAGEGWATKSGCEVDGVVLWGCARGGTRGWCRGVLLRGHVEWQCCEMVLGCGGEV